MPALSRAKELRQEIAQKITEGRAIIDTAEKEKRDLSTEEMASWKACNEDVDRVEDQVGVIEAQEERERKQLESSGRLADVQSFEKQRDVSGDEVEDGEQKRALRFGKVQHKWFAEGAHGLTAEDRQLLVSPNLADVPSAYRAQAAGGKAIILRLGGRAPHTLREIEENRREQRVQSVGTTTEGGFTVQDEPMKALEIALLAHGGMRRARTTVLRTPTGADLPIPTENDTANKGVLLAENTEETTVTDLTFGQVVLGSYKYSSDIVKASYEFMQDTTLDANNHIPAQLGTRIGRITNEHFTVGTGSGQPNGVKNVANGAVRVAASATALTGNELINLQDDLDDGYQENAEWMFKKSTLTVIRQLKTTDLQYIWMPGLTNGAPNMILDSPYHKNQDMRSIGADKRSVLYGDFSKYFIRDVMDILVLRLEELYATSAQVGFLGFSRHDGDIIDAGTFPIHALRHPAS